MKWSPASSENERPSTNLRLRGLRDICVRRATEHRGRGRGKKLLRLPERTPPRAPFARRHSTQWFVVANRHEKRTRRLRSKAAGGEPAKNPHRDRATVADWAGCQSLPGVALRGSAAAAKV